MEGLKKVWIVTSGCARCETVETIAVLSRDLTNEELKRLDEEARKSCAGGRAGVEMFEVQDGI